MKDFSIKNNFFDKIQNDTKKTDFFTNIFTKDI